MTVDARTTSVHILGHEYRIRSTEDAEFVREVALYVDEVMHRISSRATTGTTSQIAVLAALNIAEELFRERRGAGRATGTAVHARLRSLVERLEEILENHPSETPASSSR